MQLLRAHSRVHGGLSLLQFDAHFAHLGPDDDAVRVDALESKFYSG